MAKETFETIKKFLLLGFVLIGVGVILTLWVQGFTDTGSADASFSRPTASPGVFFSTTAAPQSSPAAQSKTLVPTLPPTPTGLSVQKGPSQTPDATQIWNSEQKDQ